MIPPGAGADTVGVTNTRSPWTMSQLPVPHVARKAYDTSASRMWKRMPSVGPLSTQFSCCARSVLVMLLVWSRSYEMAYIDRPKFKETDVPAALSTTARHPTPSAALLLWKVKWFSTVFSPAGITVPSARFTSAVMSPNVFDLIGSMTTSDSTVSGPALRDAPRPTL